MIKGYPLYKESESTHIGKIPKHWDTFKLGRLGRFSSSGIDKKTKEREQIVNMVNYMDVYNNKSHIIDSQRKLMRVGCPDQKIAEHSLLSGDMLFTPSSETKEDIGWSAVVTENLKRTVYSYHLIRLRFVHPMDLNFKKYMCNNFNVMNQFTESCNGTTRQILSRGDFRNTVVAIPPLTEQIQIARYLDYKNYQINKYIRIKKRQIELLKELKQTIINDAVTGKIDVRTGKPYPKYKDSGVDWLGMIPDDWVLRKLKQVASIKPSGVDKLSKEDEVPVNLCNYTDVYNNEYITSDMTFMSATVTKGEFADYSLLKGDIVVTKDSEIWNDIGVPALIIQDIADLVCAYHLCIIRPFHEDLESKFILRALQAKAYQYQFHIRANGITRYGISKNAIGYALIAVPPYDVQKSICVHVNESCLMIDAQIENINNQIPVIKELQNRLISDVVTGKMDVREIAVPDLPDEELEPAYEMEEEPVEEIENAD